MKIFISIELQKNMKKRNLSAIKTDNNKLKEQQQNIKRMFY